MTCTGMCISGARIGSAPDYYKQSPPSDPIGPTAGLHPCVARRLLATGTVLLPLGVSQLPTGPPPYPTTTVFGWWRRSWPRTQVGMPAGISACQSDTTF